MKRLFFVLGLVLFSFASSAQFKALNINKLIVRYDTTLVDEVPEAVGAKNWVRLQLKSNGDTLGVLFTDGYFWTKASISSGNISQIGTTTFIQLTIPTTLSANLRSLVSQQVIYQYDQDTQEIPDLFTDLPMKMVFRKSTGKHIATFYGGGFVWNEIPSTVTLLTQGIVRVIIP